MKNIISHNPSILFILHLPPPVHGAAMVGKYIHDSKLINSEFDCHYINLTTASSLEDIGQVGWRKVKAFFHLLQKIRCLVKGVRPDLVYITPNAAGGAFYKDFVVVMMLKRMGSKVVAHYHNKGVFTRQDRWIDNLLYRLFFKDLKVILLADALYKDVGKYVKRENVLVCPNGISKECSVKEGATHQVPHILWLSNMMLTKGLMEYLDALNLLKEEGCEFTADFVGGFTHEISQEDFQDAVNKRALSDYVNYVGRKVGEEKEAFYKSSDIFVLPSYTEAFPLTILEAMQHSLPVIATNVGGVNSAVEHGVTGLLVGGEQPVMDLDFRPNPIELAKALKILLEDKVLRQNMGNAGRIRFEQNFTLSKFEQKFCETLKSCL